MIPKLKLHILVLLLATCLAKAQQPENHQASAQHDTTTTENQPQAEPKNSPENAIPPTQTRAQIRRIAWGILASACQSDKAGDRSVAVRVLGLLPNDSQARKLAQKALADPAPAVRASAASALGDMHSRSSIHELEKTIDDSEPSVALASAHSLVLLHVAKGYEFYYQVLTGQRKASKGLIASEIDTLKDKKKLAMLGFEEGIGFVPFAGIGWSAYREITKNDSSPVMAAAARMLVNDPDPASTKALLDATSDKNWLVRAAALETLSRRGDHSALTGVEASLNDDNDAVRFTAAAATLHLMAVHRRRFSKR